MLETLNIENILFLDIETVPQHPSYENANEEIKKLWDLKSKSFLKEDEMPSDVYRRAGIYAEFGKIICISVGFIKGETFRVKSFYGDDEKKILIEFSQLLNTHFSKKDSQLCAHNGKEFDFPFMARRMLINGLKIPLLLDIAGKKPWEVNLLDTMELWKFGDYKSYTSLILLANVFGIPTPKDDIDGSMVYKVYWEEKNLERIVTYCQKDVLTVAQILLKMMGRPLIKPENVMLP